MDKLIGVCWSITEKCNLNCPICCRYFEKGELSIAQKFNLIKKIQENKIKKINFAGGEPLLDDDLLSLIEYSKSLDLKTALSTNGIMLSKELMQKFEGILDEIQLPIDGPDEEVHFNHRGSRTHFRTLINLIPEVTQHGYQVDISTVVTSKNFNHLNGIGSLINKSGVKKWKLFHFNPVSIGYKNRNKYTISESDFLSSIKDVISTVNTIEIDFGLANSERLNSYFNISPLGNFYFARDGQFTNHGNILKEKDLNDFANRSGFDFSHHKKRFWRDCCETDSSAI